MVWLIALLTASADPGSTSILELLDLRSPADVGKEALDALEAAQDSWRGALIAYDALDKRDPKRKKWPEWQPILGQAFSARQDAKVAHLQTGPAVQQALQWCLLSGKPASCEGLSARQEKLSKAQSDLVDWDGRTANTFLKPILAPASPAPAPIALMPPAELFAHPPPDQRVHPAYIPYCVPDEVGAKTGYTVLDPTKLPSDFSGSADDVRNVDQVLRSFVIDWLEGLEKVGDTSVFGHEVCIGVMDEGAKGPNSAALGGAWLLVGMKDMDTMLAFHRAGLGPALEFTVAHEFGHILQQRASLTFSGHTDRVGELHADCLAGFFMAATKGPTFSVISQHFARNEAHRIGDLSVNAPGHHGTHEERQSAFDHGWGAGLLARRAGPSLLGSSGAMGACAMYLAAGGDTVSTPK